MKDYIYGFLGGFIFATLLWWLGVDFLIIIGISVLASIFALVLFYIFFLRNDSQKDDE